MIFRRILSLGLVCSITLLALACKEREYEQRLRKDGTSLRVAKARRPLQRKLQVSLGQYFLVRDGTQYAAIRLLEKFQRNVDGGIETGVTYECTFSDDGSGQLSSGIAERGEVFERTAPTSFRGVFSHKGEKPNIQCGIFRIGWSVGNWLNPKGRWSGPELHLHRKDRGAEIAESSARTLNEIDVFSADIDWLLPW